MDRQAEALKVAEELLADIETRNLRASDVALKANRLARLTGHDDLTMFLSLERNGYTGVHGVGEWITRAGRRTTDKDGGSKFYAQPLAKVEAILESAQAALEALRGGGNYSGDYASVAGREHDAKIQIQAQIVSTWSGISGQVVATIYDLVVEIYHELLFSELQATLFAEVQTTVDGALAAAGGSALDKIERVSDRLRDGDPESVSQALTTCRRLIDSCADHLFPARDESYSIGETELAVSSSNVLNRIQAYVHEQGITRSRRDRLRVTVRELYGRCSAGTHAQVEIHEARFVFLQTYVVLGELLTLKSLGPVEPGE